LSLGRKKKYFLTHSSKFSDQDHDKAKILGTGLCMVTVGIALIIITNVINNHERERIMHYLVRP
jgi:hypothetical protein